MLFRCPFAQPLSSKTAISDFIANKKYKPEEPNKPPYDQKFMDWLYSLLDPSDQRVTDASVKGRSNPTA